MGTIRKRSGKWQAQIRRKGFTTDSRTFNRKSDADEWVRKREAQLDRHELEPDRKVLYTTTLGSIIERYRDEIVPRKRGAFVETVVLNAFIKHPICSRMLAVLCGEDFVRYRDERLSSVGMATVKRQLTPVRAALNVARREWAYPLRENPVAAVSFVKADIKRERRLTANEFDRLRTATAKNRNPLIRPIISFALETAMRRGEILAMRWEHLDLKRRSLVIPEAKNGHSRTIPLTKLAVKALASLDHRKGQVFPTTANALRLSWERLTKRARIDNLHFHDLRHEAISLFIEQTEGDI